MSPSVTFNETVKLDLFEKIEVYEQSLIWWGPLDYARFRSLCSKTVQILAQEDVDDNTFYCKRGLENWGTIECRERKLHIQAAIAVVLDQQKTFREIGINDGFASAVAYQYQTRESLIQASLRGVQDEEAQLGERTTTTNKDSPFEERNSKTTGGPTLRVKRRRSSTEITQKGKSLVSSLNYLARKITSPSAA